MKTPLFSDCGSNHTIPNGYFEFLGENTTYNSTFEVICNPGYEVHGDPAITCLHHGSWSNRTACHIKGLLFISEFLWLCRVAALKSLPVHPFNALIFPILRDCLQSVCIFLSLTTTTHPFAYDSGRMFPRKCCMIR